MSDDRTDDALRAAVADGERAQAELSARRARAAAAVSARIDRVIAGDSTAAFALHELRFAAYSRCECGAGLAYPLGMSAPGAWHCSAILRGTASRAIPHTPALPFAFYELKSEGQPSANGATTRDAGVIS